MTTATATAHESKWGFHPCDRDTILKLKETHRLLLRAYRDVKRFIRWDDKMSHNRKGECPRCPPNMIEIGTHCLDKHWFYGRGFLRCKETPQQNLYLYVLHQYEKARRPKPTPEEVEPLCLPENLDSIIEKLREFYAK